MTVHPRRKLLTRIPALLLAAAVTCALPVTEVSAQTFPSKPIHLVVGFPPGGAVDALARQLSTGLSESLGQTVIVENRAGAAGNIATDWVAKSAPDGYTMLLTTIGHAIAPHLTRKLPFDVAKDFTPVSQVISSSIVLAVNPKVPANTLQEFIALAKSKPGALNYGSSGAGDPLGLAMERLKLAAGIDVAPIQYKGVGPTYVALLGGEVQAAMVPLSTTLQYVQNGTLRVLATTSLQRPDGMPNVPTVAESGFAGFDASNWQGLFVAANTPREIVEKLQRATADLLRRPDVSARLLAQGQIPVGSTPEQFDAKVKADMVTFARVIKEAKIPMQE